MSATRTPYTARRYSAISLFVHRGSVRNRKWLGGSLAVTRRTSVRAMVGKYTVDGRSGMVGWGWGSCFEAEALFTNALPLGPIAAVCPCHRCGYPGSTRAPHTHR